VAEKKQRNWLVIVLVWSVLLGIVGVAYKFWVHPMLTGRLTDATSSDSQYDHIVPVAADAFSGYAFLRSPALARDLKQARIRLDIEDDQADYKARMRALQKGKVQLAVFTLDAFIKAGARLGFTSAEQFPGSIVLVIDQTVGADAIVAYSAGVPTLEALNHPEGRFVYTPDSPSDFLARVVTGQLSFPLLPDKWYETADGAADVLKRMRGASPKAKRAYVLWEPYLSEALRLPGAHKLFGSDRCQDCIVDVLVARREFLKEHRDVVARVVRGYLTVSYAYTQQGDTLRDLLIEDAAAAGDKLSEEQAERVAAGIQFKRTRENYVHLGLEQAQGLKSLEDLIAYVESVLVRTGAIKKGPVGRDASLLYYDGIIRELKAEDFHPGRKGDLVQGLGPSASDLASAREVKELPALAEAAWAGLVPVGKARVEPISFRRGTAEIEELSQEDLDALARSLDAWPQAYLRIVGRARAEGDAAANAALAAERARAVADYLVGRGVSRNRLRAESLPPGADAGAAEVAFILGQRPY